MSFGFDGFATPQPVAVEIDTDAHRVTGTVTTPFRRVAEILNQVPSGHLAVDHATIVDHAGGAATRVPSALVAVDAVLFLRAPDLAGAARDDMRIRKNPVRARIVLPPFVLDGTVHVAVGSRPADGLLNVHDQFLAMTGVTITSAAHPALDAQAPIIAFRRDRAEIVVLADEDNPDELLAEVLDEETARSWLAPGVAGERSEVGEP
jgi:hypothetical protein